MFDLILALTVLPIFVSASVCFRSWLIFNESKNMFLKREEELENELEILFRVDAENACSDRNLLKFNYDAS